MRESWNDKCRFFVTDSAAEGYPKAARQHEDFSGLINGLQTGLQAFG
jgi:hypothetical protein